MKMALLFNLKAVPKRMLNFAQNLKVVPKLIYEPDPTKTQQIPALPAIFQAYALSAKAFAGSHEFVIFM